MLRTYNLPWLLKLLIIMQNVYAHFATSRHASPDASSATTDASEESCYSSMLRVFVACTGLLLLAVFPSLVVSVQSRRNTLCFQCTVLAHMTIQTSILLLLQKHLLSCENTCYVMQFCSCYIFYYIWQEVRRDRTLLAASPLVHVLCYLGMIVVPICFSKAWVSDMHVNQYVLGIIFTGEVCGVLACVVHYCIECLTTAATAINGFSISI